MFLCRNREILCRQGTLQCTGKASELARLRQTFLRFCMRNMTQKQCHNTVQFWKHLNVASNFVNFMKSIIIFKFSPARCRRKILRFSKLKTLEKQSNKRIQFWIQLGVASNIWSEILQFMQNHSAEYHSFDGFTKEIAAAQLTKFHSMLN